MEGNQDRGEQPTVSPGKQPACHGEVDEKQGKGKQPVLRTDERPTSHCSVNTTEQRDGWQPSVAPPDLAWTTSQFAPGRRDECGYFLPPPSNRSGAQYPLDYGVSPYYNASFNPNGGGESSGWIPILPPDAQNLSAADFEQSRDSSKPPSKNGHTFSDPEIKYLWAKPDDQKPWYMTEGDPFDTSDPPSPDRAQQCYPPHVNNPYYDVHTPYRPPDMFATCVPSEMVPRAMASDVPHDQGPNTYPRRNAGMNGIQHSMPAYAYPPGMPHIPALNVRQGARQLHLRERLGAAADFRFPNDEMRAASFEHLLNAQHHRADSDSSDCTIVTAVPSQHTLPSSHTSEVGLNAPHAVVTPNASTGTIHQNMFMSATLGQIGRADTDMSMGTPPNSRIISPAGPLSLPEFVRPSKHASIRQAYFDKHDALQHDYTVASYHIKQRYHMEADSERKIAEAHIELANQHRAHMETLEQVAVFEHALHERDVQRFRELDHQIQGMEADIRSRYEHEDQRVRQLDEMQRKKDEISYDMAQMQWQGTAEFSKENAVPCRGQAVNGLSPFNPAAVMPQGAPSSHAGTNMLPLWEKMATRKLPDRGVDDSEDSNDDDDGSETIKAGSGPSKCPEMVQLSQDTLITGEPIPKVVQSGCTALVVATKTTDSSSTKYPVAHGYYVTDDPFPYPPAPGTFSTVISPSVDAATVIRDGIDSDSEDDGQHLIAANPTDDVFGIQPPLSQSPDGSRVLFTPTDFDSRSYTELINSCFSQLEKAIRKIPIIDIVGEIRKGDPDPRGVFDACQQHLMNREETYALLKDDSKKYYLIVGVVSRFVNDHVFYSSILSEFDCVYQAEYRKCYNEELEASKNQHRNDYATRHRLALRRAELAMMIVKTDGFGTFLHNLTGEVLGKVIGEVQHAFPPTHIGSIKGILWLPVHEALRTATRMLQDPRWFEIWFPRLGVKWNNKYHIHRNAELVGQVLSNYKSPYVIRCTVRPLVKAINFSGNKPHSVVVHRAEALVSDDTEKYLPRVSLNAKPSEHARRGVSNGANRRR